MRRLLLTVCYVAGFVACAAPPGQPPVVDEYTSVLFQFDGTDETVVDAGPSALRVPLGNAKRVPGRFGGALETPAGAVHVGYSPALDVTDGLTLEAWVRVDGPGDDLQRIAYRSSVYGFHLDRTGTSLTFYINSGGEWASVLAAVPQGRWVHLAGTYDGDWMRVYVDGEQQGERQVPGTIIASRAPLEIGGEATAQKRYLQGAVDAVRISAVARTDFETALTFEPTTQAALIPVPEGGVRPIVPQATAGPAAAPPLVDGALSDEAWRDALVLLLRDGLAGKPITQATVARLTYDEEKLYVGVRCRESRVAGISRGVTAHDGAVWTDDCVEFFLRPTPSGAYYHIAVNALGAVYDAACSGGGKTDASWQSNVVVAAQTEAQAWTVEAAFPLSAFGGVPEKGTDWRFNIGRERTQGPELSTWAPVGGKFHSPGRFGRLVLGEKATRPSERTTKLIGLAVGPDGERLEGIPIGSVVGVSRSNARGRFVIEGLPHGVQTLSLVSPRYHPFAVSVSLSQTIERVVLPPVTQVDPNALQVDVPPSASGFTLYRVAPLDDLDPAALPAPDTAGAALKAFACGGEYEPVGAAVFASRALQAVRVSVSALTGPKGAAIPPNALDVRMVKRGFMRTHYNRPPEDVGLRSRYLVPAEPFDMAPNTFRRIHVIVHVPEGTSAGAYRGTLSVSASGTAAQVLPIEFEVLPISLGRARKHYGLYYRPRLTDETEATIRMELADIRAHGANRLLWHPRIGYVREDETVRIDYSGVEKPVALLQEFGFEGPYVVWDGFELLSRLTDGEEGKQFRALAKQAILGLRELGRARGWPELVVTHMDEVFNRQRFDRYVRLAQAVRQVPEQRLYITFHNRPTPAAEKMIRDIDPYVDLRCYHGHSIDEWLAAGHTLQELADELTSAGDEAWCYYNPRSILVTAEWARLCNGFWLWLTPITTHCPWAYNSWRGDPLDDADGYDFGYAFPVGDEMIATRLWEGYREGVDDMRYLSTLEAAIARAAADGAQRGHADAARAWLEALRQELLALPLEQEPSALIKAISARYGASDYDAWRRACAEHIAKLRQQ